MGLKFLRAKDKVLCKVYIYENFLSLSLSIHGPLLIERCRLKRQLIYSNNLIKALHVQYPLQRKEVVWFGGMQNREIM